MPEGLTPTAAMVRLAARAGQNHGQTSGAAPGFVQANIAILPAEQAKLFAEFCALNAQACPVLAMSEPGDPSLPALGQGIDIRHDLPRYRVYRDGVFTDEPTDVADLWRDDLVTFAIGCSFTFEHALMEEGLEMRHVRLGRNVAMYRTAIPNESRRPVRRAAGGLDAAVLTGQRCARGQNLRPFRADARRPGACWRPGRDRHRGSLPSRLRGRGAVEPSEVPLFWACGVTSQAALQHAHLPFFLAHAPGCMLVTDVPHRAYDETAGA